MSILDLQGMKPPEGAAFSSNKSNNRCGVASGNKGSALSVTLCGKG